MIKAEEILFTKIWKTDPVKILKKARMQPLIARHYLRLRFKGYNNQEISEKIGTSANTIGYYRKKIKGFCREEINALLDYIKETDVDQ